MKVKCEYCRQMIDEGQAKCPYCGATISAVNRVADKQPKTIEELQEWYTAHNLPPKEVTRFFIGEDYKEPKAFGIYKDINGDFVVYKNKADGTRAIRYQGVDEGYAVNELYQRLKAEIADQKSHNSSVKNTSNFLHNVLKAYSRAIFLVAGVYVAIFGIIGLIYLFDKRPARGYYDYNGNTYYYQKSKWYEYDSDTDDWFPADNSDELDDTITSDTDSDYWTSWSSGKDFEDTSWYDAGSSDDSSDWDSDSSWDSSDSWDSGSTDWGSDW